MLPLLWRGGVKPGWCKNMKNIILILFALCFVSCNQPLNKLDIILSKGEIADSSYINMNFLCLKNKDSIIYKISKPVRFNYIDTLKFDSLSDGEYELKYVDIVGNTITNKFLLKDNFSKRIKIVCDSIASEPFLPKIPFNKIKDNESYRIEGKGGCIATMYCHYVIEKHNGDYYFENINQSKRLLTPQEIKAVQKFESELLAIKGKNLCISTGRMTYKIIHDGVEIDSIIDNTCGNWNGWSNLMSKVSKK